MQSDQKALLQRLNALEQKQTGTSQLKGDLSSKMFEEYQKQQQVVIVGKIGKNENSAAISNPYRIARSILLLFFVIYTLHQLNQQNEQLNEMRLKMVESLKSVEAIVVAELEEQKQSNAKKFAELEECQKQQQQNIDAEAQKRN
uniref:Endoplasmic reticulum transmembrane protein n=1 Tax=Globodera pallida TaxID=36090 RepID=A0A183CSW6_GLOPA